MTVKTNQDSAVASLAYGDCCHASCFGRPVNDLAPPRKGQHPSGSAGKLVGTTRRGSNSSSYSTCIMDKLLKEKTMDSLSKNNYCWGKDHWKVEIDTTVGNTLVDIRLNSRKKSVKNLISIGLAIFLFVVFAGSVFAACTDTDGDGFGVCPNCGIAQGCTYEPEDCNDGNVNVIPVPNASMNINANTILCPGTYYYTPPFNGQWIFYVQTSGVSITGNNTNIISTINHWGVAVSAAAAVNSCDVSGFRCENLNTCVGLQNNDYWRVHNISSNNTVLIQLNSGTDHNMMYNNTATSYYLAFWNAPGSNNTLSNSSAYNSYLLSALNLASSGNRLENSYAENHQSAVSLSNSDGITIENVTVNCNGFGSAKGIYIYGDSDNNNVTNSTIYNCTDGIEFAGTSDNNLVFYNNFSDNTLHVKDGVGTNHLNTTVGGVPQGNIYDDIIETPMRIFDEDRDGYADKGVDYPYNSSNGGLVTSNIQDYGPMIHVVDNDGDGIHTGWDCNDNNINVVVPYYKMLILDNMIFCPGEYSINPNYLSDKVIEFPSSVNNLDVRGNNTVIYGDNNALGYGIYSVGNDFMTLHDLELKNYRQGLFQSSDSSNFYNLKLTNSSYVGMYVFGSDDTQIDNITINGSNTYGVWYTNTPLRTNFTNSYIEGAFDGIYVLPNSGEGYGVFENISMSGISGAGITFYNTNNNIFQKSNISCTGGSSSRGISYSGSSQNNTGSYNSITNCYISADFENTVDDNYFYYNNVTSSGQYNVYDTSSGTNHLNTTVAGVAQGNVWDDVPGLNISDSDGDGFGDSGTEYPYNSTNGADVFGLLNDWGPIFPPTSYDNITTDERYWYVDTGVDVRLYTTITAWNTMYRCTNTYGDADCSSFTGLSTNDTTYSFLTLPGDGILQSKIRYYHEDDWGLVETPIKEQVINQVRGSYIENSSLLNTTVGTGSYIVDSDLNNSNISGCYVENSIIINSTLENITGAQNPCQIINSTIIDSTIKSSRVLNSYIDPTTIIDSIVDNVTCTNCYIEYSQLADTDFCAAFQMWGAIVTDTILNGGQLSYLGTDYYPVVSTDAICSSLPDVLVTNPIAGSVVNGTFAITYTSTENNSVEISFDGGTWTSTGSNTTYSWDTTTYQDGSHTIQLRDKDAANQWKYSNLVTVIVDNTPDSVIVIEPQSGDVIVGNVTVIADAADYVSRVDFEVVNATNSYDLDGGVGQTSDTDSSDGWSGVWDADGFGDGIYNLTVTARTRCYFVFNCYNATTTVETLYIDHTAPTGSIEIIGNYGDTVTTASTNVILNLTFTDNVAVDKCRYGNTVAELYTAPWESCVSNKAWSLIPGDGNKTVYYDILDKGGNNQTYSDNITLQFTQDTTPPSEPTVYDGLSSSSDDDWTDSEDTLSANWFGSIDDIATIYYWYRIMENGSCYEGDCNYTGVGTSTSVTVNSLALLEGTNYSFEVLAMNAWNVSANATTSDGIVTDFQAPTNPDVNSSTHPEGVATAGTTVVMNFNASDIDSSGVQSGIEGYSWMLDDWPGSAPDDIVDGRRYQKLAELKNDGYESVIKVNDTGNVAVVYQEIEGNLEVNQTVRVRFAIAEKTEDTRQEMRYIVGVSDSGNFNYGTYPDMVADYVQADADIKYAYSIESAYVYEAVFTINTSVTDGSFFVFVAGSDADDDNYNNLSIGGTDTPSLVDNSTTTYYCEESASCVENANIEYAIGVDVLDSLNDTYTVQYDNIGDGTYYFHVKAQDVAGNWGNTSHYELVVAGGGISVAIAEPVNGQLFLDPGTEKNISVNVYTSGNASVYVIAKHPDGSNYTTAVSTVLSNLVFGNVTIERGTNEIYAVANSSNGVLTHSSSVYVILAETPRPATNKTLRIGYSNCGSVVGTGHLCTSGDLGGVQAGLGSESGSATAGSYTAETIYNGIKIFATVPGFDTTQADLDLKDNILLDEVQPFFGLNRKVGDYMIRNELRYDDLTLGGAFRLAPGNYQVYLRHNGVTKDGVVNVTIVIS